MNRMMKPSYSKIIWISIILSMVMASCDFYLAGQQVEATEIADIYTDRSIITNEPCKPPCWYGITPNDTRSDQIKTLISELSFLDMGSYRMRGSNYWDPERGEYLEGELIAVDCKFPNDQQCVGITVVDEVVKNVTSYLNYSVDFVRVLENFSIPDYLRVFEQSGLYPGCNIQLIYLEEQVVVASKLVGQDRDQLRCSIESVTQKDVSLIDVDSVIYYPEIWFESIPDQEIDIAWDKLE
ncbi:MAG: hypothetical protein ACXADB_06215 [Candidatus Hermodarchaeia archaeon]